MILKLRWLFLLLVLSKVSYSQVFHNEWIDYTKPYYKFKVFGFGSDAANAPVSKGMVRIPFASIAKAGLATTDATHFQLWRDGEEVPVYMSKGSGLLGTDDYIEFVGEINTGKLDKELYREPEFQLNEKWSLQSDTAAYFLTTNTAGNNKRITDAANFVQGNTLLAERYFMHTAGRYFRNTLSNGFAAVASENIYSSSYDRGEGYVSRGVKPVGCSGSTFLPQIFPQLQVSKTELTEIGKMGR